MEEAAQFSINDNRSVVLLRAWNSAFRFDDFGAGDGGAQ